MMENTKHTKGPWYAEPYTIKAEDHESRCINIRTTEDPYRGNIAYLQDFEHLEGITRSETEANAKLIAAAPELLNALASCREALKICRDDGMKGINNFIEQANDAIKKATQ